MGASWDGHLQSLESGDTGPRGLVPASVYNRDLPGDSVCGWTSGQGHSDPGSLCSQGTGTRLPSSASKRVQTVKERQRAPQPAQAGAGAESGRHRPGTGLSSQAAARADPRGKRSRYHGRRCRVTSAGGARGCRGLHGRARRAHDLIGEGRPCTLGCPGGQALSAGTLRAGCPAPSLSVIIRPPPPPPPGSAQTGTG